MLQQILTNYVLPLLIYGFITGLANLLLAHKSQIESWAEANPRYAGYLKLQRAIGFDPWSFIAAVSLWAKKRLPAAQQNGAKAVAALVAAESVPPPSRMFPSSIPPAAALLLAMCFAFHAQACGGVPRTAADVPQDIAVAYGAASVALEVADTVETAYLDSLPSPTEAQLSQGAAIVEQLVAAREALGKVHDSMATGRDRLREVLSDLRTAETLLAAAGVKVPDKIPRALEAATEVLK